MRLAVDLGGKRVRELAVDLLTFLMHHSERSRIYTANRAGQCARCSEDLHGLHCRNRKAAP